MSGLYGDWGRFGALLAAAPSQLEEAKRDGTKKAAIHIRDEVRRGIRDQAPGGQSFEPLSDYTIARKGSSKALIDYGDLIGNINEEVLSADDAFIGVKRGVKNPNNQELVNIAVVHEEGRTIEVTPKMRAYLHSRGLHLKKATTYIRIPARPYFAPVAKDRQVHKDVLDIYLEEVRQVFEL